MGPRDAPLFVEQFEQDVQFYLLFLLLINKSCPIKRVDVVWAKDGPADRVGLRQKTLCTEQALAGPCARLLDWGNLEPVFCHIVNGYGRHESESCAISDSAAEGRAMETGKAEAYRCHAGLIDIAVPVICDGQHIATLLTGQVLDEPPSEAGFARIRRSLAALTYIDWAELEKAYWQIPVVSATEIESTTRVLEVFAQYLATTWKRLSSAVRDEQRKARELQLCRKEFAHIVLEGMAGDRMLLRDLMAKIGFNRYPNRVLVVKLESEGEYHTPATTFELAFTRALQATEEICEELPNVCCAYLRDRGICVFFSDREERTARPSFKAHGLANKLLNAISSRCDLRARVGIGGAKTDWHSLLDSYHEASMALAGSSDPIAAYKRPSASLEQLSSTVSKLCRALADRQFAEVKSLLASIPLQANREIGERLEDLGAQRHFFSYALDSLLYAAQQLSASAVPPARRNENDAALQHATSIFRLQDAFVGCAESILAEVRGLYTGNREKLVQHACRRIDLELENPVTAQNVSISRIACGLGVSAGHLSRVFKRNVGVTFERYVMMRRVELAKKMLVEPFNNVSMVAERCGFSDTTYFARVFRKIAGCSPREYRNNPMCVVHATAEQAPTPAPENGTAGSNTLSAATGR